MIMNQPLRCLRFAAGLVMIPLLCHAQETFVMERFSYAGDTVVIEFTDTRLSSDPSGAFAVEYSSVLGDFAQWSSVFGATFSSLGDTRRMATLPTSTTNGYYRIGIDTDTDGLADGQESRLGTLANDPDSDGDGFSDAIELLYETNPSDFASRPAKSVLPTVSFATDLVTLNEGDGTYSVPITLSAPYFGTLRYQIGTDSTAASQGPTPDYQPVSGMVQVGGTSAVIPLQFVDDLLIRDTRVLYVDLKNDTAGLYRRGATIRHTILLEDNDAYWNGVMKDIYSYTNAMGVTTNAVGFNELGFRLKLLQQAGAAQASLVSTDDPDSRVRGVGTIPVGEWPMETFVLGADSLDAASMPIPMPGTTLFPTSLNRTLAFQAQPAFEYAYGFNDNRIIGDFTDTLFAADGSSQHLERTNRGVFILLKDLPRQPSL